MREWWQGPLGRPRNETRELTDLEAHKLRLSQEIRKLQQKARVTRRDAKANTLVMRLLYHDDRAMLARAEVIDTTWIAWVARQGARVDVSNRLAPQLKKLAQEQRVVLRVRPAFEDWLDAEPNFFLVWLVCRGRAVAYLDKCEPHELSEARVLSLVLLPAGEMAAHGKCALRGRAAWVDDPHLKTAVGLATRAIGASEGD